MKSQKLYFLCKLVVVSFFCSSFLAGGCKKITDFVQAVDKYSYKSSKPLDTQKLPVDETLLGAYVFQELPMILTKKTETSYTVRFLSMNLHSEDKVLEAFMTKLSNNQPFFNMKLGDQYAFFKLQPLLNNKLTIKMLSNAVTIEESELKSWLVKNGNNEFHLDTDGSKNYLYRDFEMTKITEQTAFSMQKQKLLEEKRALFMNCSNYEEYASLLEKYPEDQQLTPLARKNLLKQCKTIEEYKNFIAYFPTDELSTGAKENIIRIEQFQKDSTSYFAIEQSKDIKVLEAFVQQCATPRYKQLATQSIQSLAEAITAQAIEWDWNSGKQKTAVEKISQKITYCTNGYDLDWYLSHLTEYSLKLTNPELTDQSLIVLDKAAAYVSTPDNILTLYLSRGFLLWQKGDTAGALELFRTKITSTYSTTGISFKKKINSDYKLYQKQGIVFPSAKETLKKIKAF